MNKHMISLFDGSLGEDETKRRELYRNRLREMAEQPRIQVEAAGEESGGAVSMEATLVKTAEPKVAEVPAPPPDTNEDRSVEDSPRQFRDLAEQISARFVDAVALTVRELHQHGAGEREKLEESLALMARISEGLQILRGDFVSLRAQVDSLSQSERTLSLKVATIDARLREQQDNRQQTAEKFQSFEKRMDTQAAAIRTLHSTVNEWGGRQEELRELLQKLGGMSGPRSAANALPEDL